MTEIAQNQTSIARVAVPNTSNTMQHAIEYSNDFNADFRTSGLQIRWRTRETAEG
jgi:hypothetical protein